MDFRLSRHEILRLTEWLHDAAVQPLTAPPRDLTLSSRSQGSTLTIHMIASASPIVDTAQWVFAIEPLKRQ